MKKLRNSTSRIYTGLLMIVCGFTLALTVRYRGDSEFLQFFCSAAPWILMGMGIGFATTGMNNKRRR